MKYHKKAKKNKKAFTLVETLVAIAILVTSVVAPLTIAANSMFQARYSRDQIVATYLAQESVEMIRYVRDRNMMNALQGRTADWLEFIPRERWFSPDWNTAQDGNFQICSNPQNPDSCPYLKYNGAYGLASGDNTPFRRAVKVSVNPNMHDEIVIESQVSWTSGATGQRTVHLKTRLYNWAVVED